MHARAYLMQFNKSIDIASCLYQKMLIVCTILLGLVLVPVVPSAAAKTGTKCPPAPGRTESCVCKTDKGVIDMTPFANTDGTARYVL